MTLYWDVRCRGADDLCVLGYLIWLVRSLIGGPVIGMGVAALLAPADRRWRAAAIALGVAAAPSWTLLWVGFFVWGW